MKTKYHIFAIAMAFIAIQCSTPAPDTKATDKDTEAAHTAEASEPQVETSQVTYSTESTEMIGYVAYDASQPDKRPGILVVHEWWGQNDYVRSRAEMLAELGYVALAVDMYGDGATADHPEDAMGFSSAVMQNMDESKARFEAAFAHLAAHPMVDPERISAVGYCFGGSVAMSMANAGMPLDGVAAFHSGVNLPIAPGDEVKTRMLVQNGADDPMITAEDAEGFMDAMKKAGVHVDYVSYPGVVHAFTNPGATEMGEKFELPLRYDADADARSWEKMKAFFAELYD